MITLTREEAQQVLDAVEYPDPSWFEARKPAAELLRAKLSEPEPEPEPVAKMREMLEVQGRDGTWNYSPYLRGMYNGMEFMLALVEDREPVYRDEPDKYYTTPPQREWVGLTDEELEFYTEELGLGELGRGVLRAVDDFLKEKNT